MDDFIGCKIVIEKQGEIETLCELGAETSVSFMSQTGPVTIPICKLHDEQLTNGRIMVGVGSDRSRWLIQLNPDDRSQDNDANDATPERTSAESSQPNEAGGSAESGGSKDPVSFDAQADQKSSNG